MDKIWTTVTWATYDGEVQVMRALWSFFWVGGPLHSGRTAARGA